jgi:hypothetical protein
MNHFILPELVEGENEEQWGELAFQFIQRVTANEYNLHLYTDAPDQVITLIAFALGWDQDRLEDAFTGKDALASLELFVAAQAFSRQVTVWHLPVEGEPPKRWYRDEVYEHVDRMKGENRDPDSN